MHPQDLPVSVTLADPQPSEGDALLSPLLLAPSVSADRMSVAEPVGPVPGVLVGELLALADDGKTPLVRLPAPWAPSARRALSTVDLHGANIGHPVVLMFEEGDVNRPIVMGLVQGRAGWPLPEAPAQVDVDADGQRLIVDAKEQLVLRCGKASITLKRAGKILIEGDYVSTHSSGVNRVKGASVQIN